MNWIKVDSIEDTYYGRSVRQHIREFSCVLALVLLIIAGIYLFTVSLYAWPMALISVALFVLALGYLAPRVLLPVWDNWMLFATALGIFVSTLILLLCWLLVLLPISLLLKVLRVKVVDAGFREDRESYWEDKKEIENDPLRFSKQY